MDGRWLGIFGLVICGALLGNFLWFRTTDARVSEVKRKVAEAERRNASLEKIIAEVEHERAWCAAHGLPPGRDKEGCGSAPAH